MPESRSLQVKNSGLPAIVPESKTPSTGTKGTNITGALAVFAPLAVEVIYGLTRKWLSETTSSKAASTPAGEREAANAQHYSRRAIHKTSRFQRRFHGNRG